MRPRKPELNSAQQKWIRNWWRALQPPKEGDAPLPSELWAMGRGVRAQLRRGMDSEELLTHAATLLLAERLIALDEGKGILTDEARSYERLAWVAGVLAVVKGDSHDGKSLAWHLGHGASSERPKMGELRFKTLLRSSSAADLFRHWRRAVQLAGDAIDVARLTDDLLCWQVELSHPVARGSQGIKFHWACDYYLSNREQAVVDEFESKKEISV